MALSVMDCGNLRTKVSLFPESIMVMSKNSLHKTTKDRFACGFNVLGCCFQVTLCCTYILSMDVHQHSEAGRMITVAHSVGSIA